MSTVNLHFRVQTRFTRRCDEGFCLQEPQDCSERSFFIGNYVTFIGFMELIRSFLSVIGIVWLL